MMERLLLSFSKVVMRIRLVFMVASVVFKFSVINTVWHKIFAGVYFCRLVIFFVLRELIFAIRTDCFFLLAVGN